MSDMKEMFIGSLVMLAIGACFFIPALWMSKQADNGIIVTSINANNNKTDNISECVN
jgi:hypothetical protein